MNYKSILIAGVAGTVMFAAARAMPIDATVVLLQPTQMELPDYQTRDLTWQLRQPAPTQQDYNNQTLDLTAFLLQPAPTSQNPIQRQHEDLTRYLLETAPH